MLLEFIELDFMVHQGRRTELKLNLLQNFSCSKLEDGVHPMIPLESRSHHVRCCDGELLMVGDMKVSEEMFNLEEPSQNIVNG